MKILVLMSILDIVTISESLKSATPVLCYENTYIFLQLNTEL